MSGKISELTPASALSGAEMLEVVQALASRRTTVADLLALVPSLYKGLYTTLAALNLAHPVSVAGAFADVDAGAGSNVQRYIWDSNDTAWVPQSGGGSGMSNPMVAQGDIIVGAAGGAPARLALGSALQALRVNSAGTGLEYATVSGGGLTNFTEAKNTVSPNVSVPVVALSISITETNGDFALLPKGNGALVAQIPDLTTAGGAKRGQYAVDWQRQRTAATQVASGNYSAIWYGQNNTASAPYSFSSGLDCLASGIHSWSVGDGSSSTAEGAYSFGKACLANSQYGQSTGYRATTRGVAGALARSGGGFYASAAGAAQREWIPLTYQTTNATPAVATTNQHVGGAAAATNQVTLPDNSAYRFDGRIVARSNGGDVATWDVKGLAKRGGGAGTISLVGTPVVTQVFADAGATGWVVTLGVNTTIGCLTVTVTGAASTTIRWNVEMDTVEVTAG